LPFEECDSDGDYKLNSEELGKCLESEELKGLGMGAEEGVKVMASIDR
jgi:hypothetical protein